MDCIATRELIECVRDKSKRQADVALLYAKAICIFHEETDWAAVNREIISRWRPSGLERIKRLAWSKVMP